MSGLLVERQPGGEHTTLALRRVSLGADAGHDEKWLQHLLFHHPELIPLDLIDPAAKDVVAICREFSIPKDGTTIFLDILAVTAHGRLVLVECKLWRNPQARREVIAQILEYAASLRKWSYADLTVRLNGALKTKSANPLFDHVRRHHPQVHEAAFVDAVSRSLAAGDFDLIVAGDGIRADLQAIASHLNSFSGLTSRLALLEIQLWEDGSGRTVVLPFVPYRTEIVQHRVIVDAVGIPLALTTDPDIVDTAAPVIDPERKSLLSKNRAFWQAFIDTVRFDHADQAPPRHGGNNWVKLAVPPPINWITAFRSKVEIGIFFHLADEEGRDFFRELLEQATALREETVPELSFEEKGSDPFRGTVRAGRAVDPTEPSDENEQLAWLKKVANSFVSSFRLRLP